MSRGAVGGCREVLRLKLRRGIDDDVGAGGGGVDVGGSGGGDVVVVVLELVNALEASRG